MLHGAGGSGDFARDETGWSDLADREGFLVAYPDAIAVNPAKPPKFLTNPAWWNDGSGRGGIQHDSINDVGFVGAMIDELVGSGMVDPGRVYITGFSNGAAMTFKLATELADRIAAIAPTAGHCWVTQPGPARPLPTLYIVGTEDPLIPIQGGRVRTPWGQREDRPTVADTLRKWARAIRCQQQPERIAEQDRVLKEKYPSMANGPELQSILIEGLGHHWPGGKGKLGEKLGGSVASPVQATIVIWDFFRQFRV
jgi:polyhydroxybutyrate depolymerase